ncbi:MAG: nucleotidyltransferase domain-containing protein [Candidatus Edwardsbacteria bacterium]
MKNTKIKKEVNKFIRVLKNEWRDDLISAVIFGSQVSGRTTPNSDIDLVLVKKNFPPEDCKEEKKCIASIKKSLKSLWKKFPPFFLRLKKRRRRNLFIWI